MSDQTTLYGKNNCRQGFSPVWTLRAFTIDILVNKMSDQTTLYGKNNCRFYIARMNSSCLCTWDLCNWDEWPHVFVQWEPVLRIHDILVWIRIRGSMPLTNGIGFGSGSCYFRYWLSRCQQKNYFLTQFFLLITFWRYIYIIFQR